MAVWEGYSTITSRRWSRNGWKLLERLNTITLREHRTFFVAVTSNSLRLNWKHPLVGKQITVCGCSCRYLRPLGTFSLDSLSITIVNGAVMFWSGSVRAGVFCTYVRRYRKKSRQWIFKELTDSTFPIKWSLNCRSGKSFKSPVHIAISREVVCVQVNHFHVTDCILCDVETPTSNSHALIILKCRYVN